ncbi:DUF4332 domain-containing protein [Flavivirga rizhaonensis]|uniref:DUF4332 domain-containing protein n=1 Tax=Flavivirga rizhaonensis TaxID=2559571 RepID=A0A4S1DT70_9FLAO|nr:DUF4332 domain-containing protein [Flavivirga rizhaonensis]TGV01230.1 DUF4332 domain-containing protein [Flavivirga rizhaonensis]
MGYYIDLEKITIDDYRIRLETAYLPPSRMVLKDRLKERFGYFESIGIKNVKELIQILKKKEKFSELQKAECLSGDYLILLLRELNSTLPKPVKIKDFSGISSETISKLENAGIKNTVKLFDRVINSESRRKLAAETGISEKEVFELTKLTDLSRIRWVGATFAKMLSDLEVDTVDKVTKADPIDLHTRVNQLNKEKRIYKGQIGLNDMKIVVNIAKDVPLDIKY